MSQLIDNALALRVIHMLVTNFTDTDAYKLGIIDAKGNNLIKTSAFKTQQQRDAYDYLTRLVFNLKKLINKFGGESRLKSIAAALWLIQENLKSGTKSTVYLEERFKVLLEKLENGVCLVEEEILVGKFLKEDGGVGIGAIAGGNMTSPGGPPTNNTSGNVATQEPKIYKKDIKKYQKGKSKVIFGMGRRKPVGVTEIT
jgi:hypothetical protein